MGKNRVMGVAASGVAFVVVVVVIDAVGVVIDVVGVVVNVVVNCDSAESRL